MGEYLSYEAAVSDLRRYKKANAEMHEKMDRIVRNCAKENAALLARLEAAERRVEDVEKAILDSVECGDCPFCFAALSHGEMHKEECVVLEFWKERASKSAKTTEKHKEA